MTIAGFSAISAQPLLDEARHFCPESSSARALCRRMEAHLPAALPISHHDAPAEASIPLSCEGSRLAFVYGTLKRGFGNHWLMQELLAGSHARFLGLACTKRRFPLVCGPFQVPFLLPSPSPSGHQVRGELYQVDSFAISRLDDLEGVSKGHYERRPIDIFLIPQAADADAPAHHKHSETDVRMNHSDMPAHPNGMHAHQVNGDVDDPSYLDDDTSCCTLAGPLTSCRLYMDPPYLDEADMSSALLPQSQPSGASEYLRAEAYFACPSYGLQMADRAPHIACYTEKEASTYVRRKDRPVGRTFLEHIHAWIEENGLIYM